MSAELKLPDDFKPIYILDASHAFGDSSIYGCIGGQTFEISRQWENPDQWWLFIRDTTGEIKKIRFDEFPDCVESLIETHIIKLVMYKKSR